MIYINMTPHPIYILSEACVSFKDGRWLLTPGVDPVVLLELPTVNVARASVKEAVTDTHEGIMHWAVQYGQVQGLPRRKPNTRYIVSAIVALAARAKGRRDLLVPHRVVRNAEGVIIGCLGFAE